MGHWNFKSQGKEEKSIKKVEKEGPVKYKNNQWCTGNYNKFAGKKVIICSVCQFPWCKYSHYSQLPVVNSCPYKINHL